jgi:ATP-dependent DNA helicase RecQ
MSITHAHEILKHQFGYDKFRLDRRAATEAALGGRDALVLMPTGDGKSLCYQMPAAMMGGLTVVVSPLIALMKNLPEVIQPGPTPGSFFRGLSAFAV